MTRIAVIQGHPDPAGGHFCHALAEAYVAGAVAGGHELRQIAVAELDFPLLRSQVEYRTGPLPAGLEQAHADLLWADHHLIITVTVTDPATFTRPARLSGYWLALGESILRYDCEPLEP